MSEKNSVLVKYSGKIEEAKKKFSFSRNVMEKWTSTKISFLGMMLSPKEFYEVMVENGFIETSKVFCKQCKNDGMKFQNSEGKVDGVRWYCSNKISVDGSKFCLKTCNGTRSARFNTWFYKSKLRILEILLITYFWWYKIPMRLLKIEYGYSDRTITDWASFCREVAIDTVFEHSEKIGGKGVIVEIDESEFGKSNCFLLNLTACL